MNDLPVMRKSGSVWLNKNTFIDSSVYVKTN